MVVIKRFGSILIAFVMVFSLSFSTLGSSAIASDKEDFLVLFKEKTDKDVIQSLDGDIVQEYSESPILKVSIPVNKVDDLKRDSRILSIERDKQVEISGQFLDWGITTTKAQEAWQSNFNGKGIKVAVLDTGIEKHEDLVTAGGASFIEGTGFNQDENGHGTHVAGIIGAKRNTIGGTGAAYGSSIYSVKVMGKDGTGYLSQVLEGIDWSIRNKMDIVNMSFTFEVGSPVLEYYVKEAFNRGILLVGAAGNHGNLNGYDKDKVEFPAKYSSVIAVAATDVENKRLSLSGTGPELEVSAPGVNVESTFLNNSYATYTGTSMAAPYVSANLALYKQAYPLATNQEIRELVQRRAIDLGSKGKDSQYGYGLVQAVSNSNRAVLPKRIAGKDRFEVAVNISKRGWANRADTVILANYLAFADALTSGPMAYKLNAPILLTHSDHITDATLREIERLSPGKVVLVGGTGSISAGIETELKNLGINEVQRLGGNDRFEVSYNIAKQMGETDTAMIANGLKFPDALAIAPYAAYNGNPILLTKTDELPPKTAASLIEKKIQKTIVVGGEGSVSQSVADVLPTVTRIGGKDRYEVAANIIRQLKLPTNRAYIATGSTFGDALTGSVIAAREKAPLILTRSTVLPEPTQKIIAEKSINNISVLGGTGSVSSSLFNY
ncbi:cell wall-binding repeat-containing protein [Pseudalkalibacillus caeni]|uniref:Peptidase S8/S53 domain-containing protein n=1 Tax=Exobacillus caeni TaxID=2574798 RepID=A0A5R9FFZ6_9BACL|nr:cell wall-binding repeat-containing protein [Pseudalkalibacillus caeni]TLS38475.1 hypothetical protein FCL54_04880 [Pseudalkalibacillus caeni]